MSERERERERERECVCVCVRKAKSTFVSVLVSELQSRKTVGLSFMCMRRMGTALTRVYKVEQLSLSILSSLTRRQVPLVRMLFL